MKILSPILLGQIIAWMCLILFSSQAISTSQVLKPYKGNLHSPVFTLEDMQGQTHSPVDYRGSIVLVQFWATYCTPCRKEMPSMNRLIKKMEGQPFKILAVDMAEPRESVQKFIDQVPVDFTVLLDTDGSTLNAWKVFAAPANFILNKQGEIIYTLYGAIDWESEEIVQTLTTLTSQ